MSNVSPDLLRRLEAARIIPVIALPSAEDALPLAKALAEGGLPCAEITFRTEAGREGIRRIASEHPDFLLGAGTVTTPEEVDAAKEAGAQFAVAPGCNPCVIERAFEVKLPFLPGVMTPSDIERALGHSCTLLKFFPAEAAGGLAMLKALHAPYKHRGVRFIPTGGITAQNCRAYLDHESVLAVGGSWLAATLREKNWERISAETREAQTLLS